MGTYLVTHKLVLLGQQIRNTFYYVTTVGEPSDSEWTDIADEIRSDWDTNLKPAMSTSMELQGIDRRRVDSAGLLTFPANFTSGALAGTSAVDPVASQIALLVSNKGTTTKPNRARTYLAGFCEDDLNLSLWGSSPRGEAETFIDLQSDLNSGGTNPLQRVAAQWNTSHTYVSVTNDLSGAASVASTVPAT